MPTAEMRNATPSSSAATLQPHIVFPLLPKYRRASDPVTHNQPWLAAGLVAKRIFDFVGSALLLLLLSPLLILLMILIAIDSPGSPFFRHDRIGLHGRTFRIWKFRTMSDGAHGQRDQMLKSDHSRRLLFKNKRDPRVTRFGRFLRKFSLDELPQLINVMRGEMSLIGPRPLLKEDFQGPGMSHALYRLWVRDRHRLWPGITGLWQVSGRNELSFDESMGLDLHYVIHWSPWMDLVVLCKTLPAVFAGRGAY